MTDDTEQQPQSVPGAWPDPQTGPFRLRLWFGTVDEKPAVVGVEMWGVDPVRETPPWFIDVDLPDVPIGAEDIRLPLGRLRDDWVDKQRSYARASRALWGDVPPELRLPQEVHEAAVQRFERRLGAPKRVGRPPLSDELLGRVTAIYNEAVTSGDRKPALRVKTDLEKAGLARADTPTKTVRGWIGQARKRGFPVVAPPQQRRH